ncbi:MAG: alpha/beta fold hydrolase [Pseudomonadota bacterium]
MRKSLPHLLGALCLLVTPLVAVAQPQPMPLEFFAAPQKFKTAVLSPDGRHIAFTYEEGNNEGKLAVATTDLKTITAVYAFGDNKHVGGARWINNERLVMTNWLNTGFLDGRRQDPRLFVGGYDGSNRRALETGNFMLRVVDALESDPDNFLVMRRNFMMDRGMKLHKVDATMARSDFFPDLPKPDDGAFIVDLALDSDDRVRIAIEWNPGKEDFDADDDTYRFHYRELDWEWRSMEMTTERQGPNFQNLGFGPGDRHYYFLSNYDQASGDTMGVFRFDFDSGEINLIHRHPDVNIESAIRGPDGQVLGVSYQPGYPTEKYFYPDNPVVRKLKSLQAAFPGQVVRATSYAQNGTMATVSVSSDRNPGELYLFKEGKLHFLASSKPENDPERLGSQEAFTMTARDGKKLYGYLTLPPGREDKDLPMVVWVHGGPHGPYDRWGYDSDVQAMASHGYAVLQVNFRGSGGYGDDFERSGYREWGRAMQDDVTDATLWAIDQGIADRNRICIGGGSYGGYAALQGTVREPSLYQCAIGYVGVYSLPMMQKKGDYRQNRRGSNNYFEDVQGRDEAELKARSPAYNVEAIEAELFIVHGSEDVRVPLDQAKFLRKQLDAIGKDYEWMVRKEGHGFSNVENRVDFYDAVLSFLDRHIGSQRDREVAAAP